MCISLEICESLAVDADLNVDIHQSYKRLDIAAAVIVMNNTNSGTKLCYEIGKPTSLAGRSCFQV